MSDPGSGNHRIVVDWDGTCVEIAYPAMGDWIPGAIEGLHKLLDAGFEVVIFSTRLAPVEVDEVTPLPPGKQDSEIAHIRRMLDEAGLEAVGVWTKPWKPGGWRYIDDKAIPFYRESKPGFIGSWGAITFQLIGG